MVVVLCDLVQGQSSHTLVKEKGPHGAGQFFGSVVGAPLSVSRLPNYRVRDSIAPTPPIRSQQLAAHKGEAARLVMVRVTHSRLSLAHPCIC